MFLNRFRLTLRSADRLPSGLERRQGPLQLLHGILGLVCGEHIGALQYVEDPQELVLEIDDRFLFVGRHRDRVVQNVGLPRGTFTAQSLQSRSSRFVGAFHLPIDGLADLLSRIISLVAAHGEIGLQSKARLVESYSRIETDDELLLGNLAIHG